MDALRHTVFLSSALSVLVLAGCEPMNSQGGVAPRNTRHDDANPPQIVTAEPTDSDADPNMSDVEPVIAEYVRWVGQAPTEPAEPTPPPPTDPQPAVRFDPDPPPAREQPEEVETAAAVMTPDDVAIEEDADPAPPLEPPMMTGVMVNSARPIDLAPQTALHATTLNEPTVASEPASLEEVLKRYYSEPQDESYRAQLDARIIRVLAGDYAGARAPLDTVSKEQQELATRFVEALIAIRDVHLGNLSDGTNKALGEIDALLTELADVSELSISNFTLCSRVDAFGAFTPIAGEFTNGRSIAFATYCEPRNLVAERRADGLYYTELDMTTEVLSRVGENILTLSDKNITDKCSTRRRDFFIARPVNLPATLSPGEYVVKVTITDKLGEKVAQSRATFQVVIR